MGRRIEQVNFKWKNMYSENRKYKLIYIILDGLRYDLYEQLNLYDNIKSNCIDELLKEVGHNRRVSLKNQNNQYRIFSFKSLAGLPTLTTIRLQNLFTGRISQFFDSLYAFSHFKIKNENIFNLLSRAKRTFSFFGDCTIDDIIDISNIKKKCEKYTQPYNTTIVDDLETIFTTLLNLNKTDVQYVHLNYLDSLGHKKGIHHRKYRKTLRLYEKFIRVLLYLNAEKNLLILLTSDHGVNDDGSHGQGTDADRSAFFSLLIPGGDRRIDGIINQDEIIQTLPYLLNCDIPNSSISNIIHQKSLYFDFNGVLKENIKRNIYFLRKLNLLGDLLEMKFISLEKVDRHIRDIIHENSDNMKLDCRIIIILILMFIVILLINY